MPYISSIFWQTLKYTKKNVWGDRLAKGGSASLIINRLNFADLSVFVNETTDEEKVLFIQTMRYGTKVEQQLAVDAAWDLVMKSYGLDR